MRDNCIIVELNLPGLRVDGQRTEGDTQIVTVRYRCMRRPCPGCGQETSRVHQYHRQQKHHVSLWGQRVILEMRKRRFRCQGCRRVFMEQDEVCGWRRRSTLAFRQALAEDCRIGTIKAVAAKAGVSEALTRRAFGEMASQLMQKMAEMPAVVALDEVYLGAKLGCYTVLYAPEERYVLELWPGRTQESAETLLMVDAEEPRVAVVVMDMAEAYRQAVKYACPGAVIVADKFHVLRRVLRSLEQVTSRVQAKAETSDRRSLRRRRLFTAASKDLSEEELRERDRLLEAYPALAEAWRIAQAFRGIYQARDREQATRELEALWAGVQTCGPREFCGLKHMLTHWREEILSYFTHHVTNGFAEGKNNRSRVIIHAGYWYRNIDNLIQRIMMANPQTLT